MTSTAFYTVLQAENEREKKLYEQLLGHIFVCASQLYNNNC